ncbi:MAG: HU family DNA-binding protein [Desulfobacteraceae bacterium]|nr:HU family DNA-binding protein [Desulfobacteraceae bacterium]
MKVKGRSLQCSRKATTKERKVRNPATGEDLMLEPRKIVMVRCSGKLRETVNGQ